MRLAKGSKYGAPAYQREFGKISSAIVAAGMKPHQIRGLSKQDVIDDLKNVYKKLGHIPQHEQYKKASVIGYSFPTIRKMFGSWTNALIEAGIPVENSGKVDKKFALRELKKWHTKHNGNPNALSYWTLRKAKKRRDFPISCATSNHCAEHD